ncbi:putative HNHc nuclease [Weissella tructae]|uniref:putative HNHc nuclease n=1 Tax=Weissella tructae TaxID=887702 RepID=UPI003D940D29
MELWGRIVSIKGNMITFAAVNPEELRGLSRITSEKYPEASLTVTDTRQISPSQKAKAHAILRDMANESGSTLLEMKTDMKNEFCEDTGHKMFSLSNTDVTTARYFISFLLEKCFQMDIPLKKGGMEMYDDLEDYQYICLAYRKCVLCQKPAEVHHLDRVGLNLRDRTDHRKKRLVALCHQHHAVAQKMSAEVFADEYHIPGIFLDEETLHDLGIMTYEQMREKDRRKQRDDQSSGISRPTN